MIVPMKKLSMLLYHKERESFLTSLQDLGVVHIEENPEITSEGLESLQGKLKISENVIKALKKIEKELSSPVTQEKEANAEEVIEKYGEYEQQIEKIDQKITSLKKDIKALSVWGNFEPSSVERLKNAGINLRFFELSEKKFEELNKDDLYFEVINRQSGTVFFTVVEKDEPLSVEADEVILPNISLGKAEQEVKELEAEKADVKKSLEGLVKYRDVIQAYFNANSESRDFEAARLSMENTVEGRVLYLTGWLPEEKEKKVEEFLNKFATWFEIQTPSAEDKIPVLLKNNSFTKLFEPILKLFQLPSYFEIDPTFFIAPFFAIFFGNCLGDTGYGLIIFLLTTILQFYVPKNMKVFVGLGQILGLSTLIMGTLNSGTFFGAVIKDHLNVPGFGLLNKFTIIKEGVLFDPFNFALLLGVIQMTVGMILNIYNKIRYFSFKEALPGIGKILLIESSILLFLILYQKMDVLRPLLMFAYIGGVCGFLTLVYVAFFTDLEKFLDIKIVNLILKLYFVISGAVGDVLSYIRLFALGLSSGILGYVVNVIGGQIRDGIPGVGWIVFIIFIIVGHTGNLVLSSLGSFVHPLRLTFVEFYNNLEFTGGGKEYKPFKNYIERSKA
jgi:V/A-type H+-transporting ATPase subunit I